MKKTACFYKIFGGYANYTDKVWYNCPKCLEDDKNKECKYYVPVMMFYFEVKEKEKKEDGTNL